ncbi:D-aminoacyl-tRNA deacylase [Psychrobacter sp.]|uniref:D-aminoacyl-tRNA deacylase n=1 Tax=Psychrobacter sp. TaxID=56811 RepID=UPI0025FECC00|nr:D-aminoacyl-tRNA deacylase [Psychrobacter sp.]
MKTLIQRVTKASVVVEGNTVGEINKGILAYIGLGPEDTLQTAKKMIDKILTYRIFDNEAGKLDQNVQQVQGGLLLVSQFTLMAKTDKGRRPDFGRAMAPQIANALFEQMVAYAKQQYGEVKTGEFGANMLVKADNDGPLNFILEIDYY